LYAKLIGLVLFQFLVMPLRAKNIDLSPVDEFDFIFGQFQKYVDRERVRVRNLR
jgi:hypothetical protein